MENFFGHLKAECLNIQKFGSVEDLTQAIHSLHSFLQPGTHPA
ncbi:IS3 family transposase [Paenibacillus brasilensis]